MALDPMIARVLLGGKPSQEEVQRWLSSKVIGPRNASKAKKVLDLSDKVKPVILFASNNPKDIIKAAIIKKVTGSLYRKLFNH